MWIILSILLIIIASGFSFLLGWGLAIKFKTFYNYINYLRGREEWKAKAKGGNMDVIIYSGSFTEAKAIARLHQSIIDNA